MSVGLKDKVRGTTATATPTRRRRKAKPSMADGLKKRNLDAEAPSRPIVPPSKAEPKSGCMFCSLFPWSEDFAQHSAKYERDAEKITGKEPDGHTMHTRCVEQEWEPCDILFVGETPTADEDKQGKNAVGRGGALLTRTVEEFVGDEATVGYTNLVRCRPPRGKPPTNTEVKCCNDRLLREIAARQPKLVVCMGNKSLEFLGGQSGITTFTGRFLDCVRPEFPDLKVIACLNPLYVLKMDHEIEKFAEAIERAKGYVTGEVEMLPGHGDYYSVEDFTDAVELLDMMTGAEIITFDTETGSLDWTQTEFPPLLCFSFTDEEGVGYTLPWDHEDSPWAPGKRDEEREQLADKLRQMLTSPALKIAQNEKFDRKHIRHALGVDPTNVLDTMLIHLTLEEKRGTHGLKELAFAYTGMGGYDDPLENYKKANKAADPQNGGSYANIPGDLLFPYAAMDADVTMRVYRGLIAEEAYRRNLKFRNLAEEFFPALSEALADLEYEGAQIDPEVAALLDDQYTHDIEAKRQEMLQLPEVQECVEFFQDREDGKRKPGSKAKRKIIEFNPKSPVQMRHLLFNIYGLKPTEMTDTGFERLVERWKRLKQTKEHRKLQFQAVVDKAIEDKQWEYFSTSADVLHVYERDGNTFATTLLEHRGMATLHGTFLKPLAVLPDHLGRIHGTFHIHGTVTGRLSSSDPNLQNIPNKGGGKIKQAYVSRFGDEGVLLQLDYSQVELRVAASYFNEPTMIQAYCNGDDLHALTAQVISGLTEAQYAKLPDKEKKAWRTRAKRVNFGIVYGGGPPALQATLKKDGVFLTVDECRELIDRFFQKRPALKKGIEKLQELACKQGFLESFTGRRRRVPEVFSEDDELVARALRQSVNFPIQSSASDMTLMAIVLINREMKARGFQSRMILTVHDSIIFDCHVDEVMEVSVLAKDIMETLPERSEEVLPGLDWSWLKCPIVAECEMGFTWGGLCEFDPGTVIAEDIPEKPFAVEEDGKTYYREPHSIDELWEIMESKHAA